jgi:hypothetical protein
MRKRTAARVIPVYMCAAAAIGLCAALGGCAADAAAPPEFGDWGDAVFSEETERRAAEEERAREETVSEEEKDGRALAHCEEELAALLAERERLAEDLAYIRETAALPELGGALGERYAALAAETEEAIAQNRAEEERLLAESERIKARMGPPPGAEPPDGGPDGGVYEDPGDTEYFGGFVDSENPEERESE